MDKNSFTQLIKGSTHSAGGTLDLVLINSRRIKLIFNLNIGKDLLSKISDHCPVCFSLDVDQIGKNQSGKLMTKTRNLGLLVTNMFELLLLNSSLSKNFDTLSLHQSVEKYNSALLDSLDQGCPTFFDSRPILARQKY